METQRSLPVVLSIAGSDNSAGAGIQADLKTMSAVGVYGVTAVTCVVAEVPGKVSAIQAMSPEIVTQQIQLLFEAFPVRALKTGMLYSPEIIEAVCAELQIQKRRNPRLLIVVDPVMVATSGHSLLKPEAVSLYEERLLPMATLATPNLDEVAALLGRGVHSLEAMREAGRELVDRYGTAFLIKGGHLRGAVAVDLLCTGATRDGDETRDGDRDGECIPYQAPFVPGVSTHGTGCSYAAAIASALGLGLPLQDAVARAKTFVSGAISGYLRWEQNGHTTDALDHFSALRPIAPRE